jgi:hypothetical protein
MDRLGPHPKIAVADVQVAAPGAAPLEQRLAILEPGHQRSLVSVQIWPKGRSRTLPKL